MSQYTWPCTQHNADGKGTVGNALDSLAQHFSVLTSLVEKVAAEDQT